MSHTSPHYKRTKTVQTEYKITEKNKHPPERPTTVMNNHEYQPPKTKPSQAGRLQTSQPHVTRSSPSSSTQSHSATPDRKHVLDQDITHTSRSPQSPNRNPGIQSEHLPRHDGTKHIYTTWTFTPRPETSLNNHSRILMNSHRTSRTADPDTTF